MRTTVFLPPALMRAAKTQSAERGETLKMLFTRAVAAELGQAPSPAGRRVTLPLFGGGAGAHASPSNADLEQALADADAARLTSRRRSGR